MSNNRIVLEGMTELREALRQLPEELTGEADGVVVQHASDAHRLIQAAYPVGRTGNLSRRVTVSHTRTPHTTQSDVKSRAPHASIYEYGTKGRSRKTSRGWDRGVMRAATVDRAMIPIVVRVRQRMVQALMDVVRRAGFQVEG